MSAWAEKGYCSCDYPCSTGQGLDERCSGCGLLVNKVDEKKPGEFAEVHNVGTDDGPDEWGVFAMGRPVTCFQRQATAQCCADSLNHAAKEYAKAKKPALWNDAVVVIEALIDTAESYAAQTLDRQGVTRRKIEAARALLAAIRSEDPYVFENGTPWKDPG